VRQSLRLSRNTTGSAARTLLIAFAALATLAASACGPAGSPLPVGSAGASAPPTAAADAIKVVTTTTVFADIVQNVGGSRVVATSIIPAGVGPED
jgi:ABC-type Zn uptake system ZnuABC Zn-binding protein ZnuA